MQKSEKLLKRSITFLGIVLLIFGIRGMAWGEKQEATTTIFRAGVAARVVNPTKPAVPIGHRGTTAYRDLHADLRIQAMAVEDSSGTRVAWMGWDNCFVRAEVCQRVKKAVEQQFHIPPAAVCINASHTHSAPALIEQDSVKPEYFDAEYAAFFESQAIAVVGDAVAAMVPARLRYCEYPCTAVAINRRKSVDGKILMQPNPQGVVDHRVQVIAVESPEDSRLIGVCVKYACHPVTVGPRGLGSDYPGFMRKLVEQWHPGSVAIFLLGCCADVRIQVLNPQGTEFVTGTVESAQRFGRDLALSVEWAIKQSGSAISGPIEYDYKIIDLPLASVTAEEYRQASEDKKTLTHPWGELYSKILDRGETISRVNTYHIQVFRLGRQSANPTVLVTLGGEVVTDYARNLAAKSPGGNLIVLGYSNDIVGYIPTAKMLQEGGYEPTAYRNETWLSGPYQPETESLILDAAARLAWPEK
jgi:neutral ceramidase